MAENTCSGDCLKCNPNQRLYCAAQHGHAIAENQRATTARLDAMEAALMEIKAALSGFAANTEIINPLKEERAQNGDGAENRPPENTI